MSSTDDRVPARQKLAFSLGYGVDYLAAGLTTGVLWMPFFNIGLGIAPATLGLLLMALRAWDAVTDPLMGHLSDNFRGRWGRRRPFIALGAALTAALYLLLWRVPEWFAPEHRVLALGVLGVAYFTAYTVWSVPFYSLQMELTPDYDERTRLAAWVAVAGKVVYLAGGWVLALATSASFADPETGRPDIVRGMQACAWVIAALILALGLLPALFVPERMYAGTASRQPRAPLWPSLRESARCGPLRGLIGVSFFLILGSATANTLGQYVAVYLVCAGDLAAASVLNGWKATGVMVVGLLGIPLWTRLSLRFDKKTLVAWMLGGSVAGHLLNLVCLDPARPWLMLVPAIFEAGAIGAVWLFMPSMKADVADHDELETARRREGSLNAFYSWFTKVAVTLGAGAGGLVLQWTGLLAAEAAQPPEVLASLRVLYIALPVALWTLTLVFLWRYPLTRVRAAEIRAALETRRGRV